MTFKSNKYCYCVYTELSIRIPFCRVISEIHNNFIYNEGVNQYYRQLTRVQPEVQSRGKMIVVWNTKLRLWV